MRVELAPKITLESKEKATLWGFANQWKIASQRTHSPVVDREKARERVVERATLLERYVEDLLLEAYNLGMGKGKNFTIYRDYRKPFIFSEGSLAPDKLEDQS